MCMLGRSGGLVVFMNIERLAVNAELLFHLTVLDLRLVSNAVVFFRLIASGWFANEYM